MRKTEHLRIGLFFCVLLFSAWLAGEPSSPELCSLINLIATPEQYDGKEVIVVAAARVEPEHQALYFCQEHADRHVLFSAVWLEFADSEIAIPDPHVYDGDYVVVEGSYDKDSTGHLGAYHGTIHRITRIQRWRRQDESQDRTTQEGKKRP